MRRYNNSSCTDTIGGLLNISLRSASFIKEVSSGKNSWDYCFQVLDYQDFLIIRHWITRIFLCLFPSMFSCMNFRLTINSTGTQTATGILNETINSVQFLIQGHPVVTCGPHDHKSMHAGCMNFLVITVSCVICSILKVWVFLRIKTDFNSLTPDSSHAMVMVAKWVGFTLPY